MSQGLRRRELLAALLAAPLGLPALVLPSCTGKTQPDPLTMLKHIDAQQISDLYAAHRLDGVEAMMPGGAQVVIDGLVFHDWAYPQTTRVDPLVWGEVTRRDANGGHVYHGIKLRIPGEHDQDALHRSGPKVIGFLPYADDRAVQLLKRAYSEPCDLSCTVSWIGVLSGEVWGESEVGEDDMVGLRLHGVDRMS